MKRLLVALAIGVLWVAASGLPLGADKNAANVAGTWDMVTKGPQGDYNCDLVLRQDGTSLSGSVHTSFGEGPLQGSIKGNSIHFQAKLEMEEGAIDVDYSGTVSGDAMKGTYKAADDSGTWSAVRPHSSQ
ncbi:MAG: hypothetical protein ACLP1Y_05270 [Candidatus Acidiferrales bacterium]